MLYKFLLSVLVIVSRVPVFILIKIHLESLFETTDNIFPLYNDRYNDSIFRS